MPSDESDFRKFSFKSPDIVDRKWLEWFREEYSRRFYKLDIDPSPDAPFRMEAAMRVLPDLAISHSVRSPMRTSHRGGDSDDFGMQVLLSGRASFTVGGKSHDFTPGMGSLGRQGTPAIIDIPEETRLLSIRLRRDLLEPLIKGFSDRHGFVVLQNTQALRLLLGYIPALDEEDTIETPRTGQLVTTHIHDLVALAYGATGDAHALIEERGKRAARLAAIKADVIENLARPDLSAPSVAARQGVTRRYVDMLFEAEGATFSEFVVGQRLARARHLLTDPRLAHLSVSAISLRVGFGDLSYFNRTFRRRFGATPSDVRESARRNREG